MFMKSFFTQATPTLRENKPTEENGIAKEVYLRSKLLDDNRTIARASQSSNFDKQALIEKTTLLVETFKKRVQKLENSLDFYAQSNFLVLEKWKSWLIETEQYEYVSTELKKLSTEEVDITQTKSSTILVPAVLMSEIESLISSRSEEFKTKLVKLDEELEQKHIQSFISVRHRVKSIDSAMGALKQGPLTLSNENTNDENQKNCENQILEAKTTNMQSPKPRLREKQWGSEDPLSPKSNSPYLSRKTLKRRFSKGGDQSSDKVGTSMADLEMMLVVKDQEIERLSRQLLAHDETSKVRELETKLLEASRLTQQQEIEIRGLTEQLEGKVSIQDEQRVQELKKDRTIRDLEEKLATVQESETHLREELRKNSEGLGALMERLGGLEETENLEAVESQQKSEQILLLQHQVGSLQEKLTALGDSEGEEVRALRGEVERLSGKLVLAQTSERQTANQLHEKSTELAFIRESFLNGQKSCQGLALELQKRDKELRDVEQKLRDEQQRSAKELTEKNRVLQDLQLKFSSCLDVKQDLASELYNLKERHLCMQKNENLQISSEPSSLLLENITTLQHSEKNLAEELAKKSEQLSALEEEVVALRESMASRDASEQQSAEELASSRETIESCRASELLVLRESLSKTKEQAKARAAKSIAKIKSLQAEISRLDESNQKSLTTVIEKTDELSVLRTLLLSAEEAEKTAKAQCESQAEELSVLKHRLESSEGQRNNLRDEMRIIENQLDQQRKESQERVEEVTWLQQQLSGAEQTQKRFSVDLEKKKKKIELIQHQLAEAKMINLRSTEECDELKKKLVQCQRVLAETTKEQEQLNLELNWRRTEMDLLEHDCDLRNLRSSDSQVSTGSAERDSEVQGLELQLRETTETLRSKEVELATLRDQLMTSTMSVIERESEIQRLETKVKKSNKKLFVEELQAALFRRQARSARNGTPESVSTLGGFFAEDSDSTSGTGSSEQLLLDQQRELEKLRASLKTVKEQAKTRATKSITKVKSLQAELQCRVEDVKKYTERLTELEALVEELQKQRQHEKSEPSALKDQELTLQWEKKESAYEEEITVLKAQLESEKKGIDDQNTELEQCNQTLADLSLVLDDTQRRLTEALKREGELEAVLASIKSDFESVRGQMAELEGRHKEQTMLLERAVAAKEEAQARPGDTEDELDNSRKEVRRLKAIIKNDRLHFRKLKKSLAKLAALKTSVFDKNSHPLHLLHRAHEDSHDHDISLSSDALNCSAISDTRSSVSELEHYDIAFEMNQIQHNLMSNLAKIQEEQEQEIPPPSELHLSTVGASLDISVSSQHTQDATLLLSRISSLHEELEKTCAQRDQLEQQVVELQHKVNKSPRQLEKLNEALERRAKECNALRTRVFELESAVTAQQQENCHRSQQTRQALEEITQRSSRRMQERNGSLEKDLAAANETIAVEQHKREELSKKFDAAVRTMRELERREEIRDAELQLAQREVMHLTQRIQAEADKRHRLYGEGSDGEARREMLEQLHRLRCSFTGFVLAQKEEDIHQHAIDICSLLEMSSEQGSSIERAMVRLAPMIVASSSWQLLTSEVSAAFSSVFSERPPHTAEEEEEEHHDIVHIMSLHG